MVKFNVDGVQNVEVSKKIPCEKSLQEQLEIMEKYTETHRRYSGDDKAFREIECLKVLYPRLFRQIQPQDKFIGRIDFLPVGFGCVTSLGGAGHYCVFSKLREFQARLDDENEKKRVDALYSYWLEHDLKTIYCRQMLTETTVGRFIDCDYPLIATARLSGMMLDYKKLLRLGIGGLRNQILCKLETDPENAFLKASLECLDLFDTCADVLCEMAAQAEVHADSEMRKKELRTIQDSLKKIKNDPPETFHQALQLFWLYAMLAGVINYGRMDDLLGPYLVHDLKTGLLTDDEAYGYIESLWTMIENRRTTVNGRIIVGGAGREHPEEADVFLHYCMKAAYHLRYVEPQFTLRFTKDTSEKIWDEALDAIGAGATYPTLYNDDVNVPAVAEGMRIPVSAAEQYVPFGCTEFVIQGQSTGTPNICINLLKILTILLNEGIDPTDGKYKMGSVKPLKVNEYQNYYMLKSKYYELLDYYMDLAIRGQMLSYKVMNEQVSFLFTSILMDDCLSRGKSLLDGGVRYLGGTCETYGNINTSDALWAIKYLVFETHRYTLAQLEEAALHNFEGYALIRKDLWKCDKYGNDLDTADGMALELYHKISMGIRERGIAAGMQYFLIVISNNQLNTEWGRRTAASLDGRFSGMYMNPANNPQGGANQNGPTAMLNSLAKFEARFHAGSVQNIKFSPAMFNQNRAVIKALFKTYFARGGCHLMVTVVSAGELEDAVIHPERHQNLIVRVSGFSAVFINLDPDIQQEVISRVLYE